MCMYQCATYNCVLHTCLLRNYDKALGVLQRATAMPARKAAYHDAGEAVQHRLYKNLKVWAMYADLEESLGTFEVRRKREGEKGRREEEGEGRGVGEGARGRTVSQQDMTIMITLF